MTRGMLWQALAMPLSERDLRYVRTLIHDALALADVLPHRTVEGAQGLDRSGQQIETDLSLAETLLSETASAVDKETARREARDTVHPSNQHGLD